MLERRISFHKDTKGEVIGVSIDPSRLSESARHEFAVRNLQNSGKKEEFLLFRRGQGLVHITSDDLHDLRLMFKHGDFPEILSEGFSEEIDLSKRVTKVPAKTITSS